ncbi:MAG: YdcF family protein [Alphaproteobacteria bacterium]|nr:YdcF family protein [Alphaproteobacteria bacterium]
MLGWWLVLGGLLAPPAIAALLRRRLLDARLGFVLVLVAPTLGLALGYVGFASFAAWLSAQARPVAADGIVALSGRMERLHAAFDLLRRGVAPVALLSGTGEGANDIELGKLRARDPALFDARVTLDPLARNTRGNAQQIRAWVAERQIKRLLVVSTDLHLPRALLHLSQALPGIELVAFAVAPQAETAGGWVAEAVPWPQRIAEFLKFLLAPLPFG